MRAVVVGAWRDDRTGPIQVVSGAVGRERVHYEAERNAYYDVLEQTQQGSLDVTSWMEWLIGCLGRAIAAAEEGLGTVLGRARFWERFEAVALNARQRQVLTRLLDGFDGKLTSSKYAKLAKCSQDTAARDMRALVDQGVLIRNAAGGRSTSYDLAPSARS